ncbi:CAP domain-containing protein, partial [Acinetobacter baumannii]|nr:CAP domain-containing protein [Acinetobacter baumannii]
ASYGVHPLKPEAGLERWAYLKSKHMADNNYFAHDYNGMLIDEMYPNEGGSVPLMGENIFGSYGKRTPSAKEYAQKSFEGWKNSP